mgnify:CR=1 FL=1
MTFGEKLNEHNKYCQKLVGQAEKLISQANGESEKQAMFIENAERVIGLLDVAIQKFETEHNNELRKLELFENNSERVAQFGKVD